MCFQNLSKFLSRYCKCIREITVTLDVGATLDGFWKNVLKCTKIYLMLYFVITKGVAVSCG